MNTKRYKREKQIFKDYIKVPTPMKSIVSQDTEVEIEKMIKEVKVEPFTKTEKYTEVVEVSKILKKPFQDKKLMIIEKEIDKEVTKIEVREVEKEREIIDQEANAAANIYLNKNNEWVQKTKEEFINKKEVLIREGYKETVLDKDTIKKENLKEINGIYYKEIEKEIKKTRAVTHKEEVFPIKKTVKKTKLVKNILEEQIPVLVEKTIETVLPVINVENIENKASITQKEYIVDKIENEKKGIYQRDNKWFQKKEIKLETETRMLTSIGGYKKILNMQSIKDNNLILKNGKCFYIENTEEEEVIELLTTKVTFPFYKKEQQEYIDIETIQELTEIEVEEEYQDIEIKYKEEDRLQLKIVKKPIDDIKEIDFMEMEKAGLYKKENANKIEDCIVIGNDIINTTLNWGSLNKVAKVQDKTIMNKLIGHFQVNEDDNIEDILSYKTDIAKIEITNTGNLELFNNKYLLLNELEESNDTLKIKVKKGYTDSLLLNIKKTDLINLESINNLIFALVNQNGKNASIFKKVNEVEDFIQIKLSAKKGEIIKEFWMTVPSYMNNILVHSIEVSATADIKMPYHFKNEQGERIDSPNYIYKEKKLIERIEKLNKKVLVPYEEITTKTRLIKKQISIDKKVDVIKTKNIYVLDEEKNKENNIFSYEDNWYIDMIEEYSVFYTKANLREIEIPMLNIYIEPTFVTSKGIAIKQLEIEVIPCLTTIDRIIEVTNIKPHMYEINKRKLIDTIDTDYQIEPVEREQSVTYEEEVIDISANASIGYIEEDNIWYKNTEAQEEYSVTTTDIERIETPFTENKIDPIYKEIEFKDYKYKETIITPLTKLENYIENENFEVKEIIKEIIEVEELVNFTNYREETVLDIEEQEQERQIIDYKKNEEENYYTNEYGEWVKQALIEVETIISTQEVIKNEKDTYKIAELGLIEIDNEYYMIQEVEEEVLVFAN
jgi:hypothetical protein